MSFYSDASLVMIPSGYKNQKVYCAVPTDGLGDLTFSRASDATRVGSDGLIEKVRTNHILQSNTFDVTWGSSNLTVTSGATAPDGTATAYTIANTAASGIIQQAATLTGLRSVSIYAKAGTHEYLYMGIYSGVGTASYQVFDLTTGTITFGSKGLIEDIGGGWYRCTSFGADGTTGGVQIFPSNNATGAGTTNGNILIYECQYETGDIATDYIATTTAAVSVGPVSGLPRLDYYDSTCPRLLLEPQRTNLALYSEQFDNAYWTKTAGTTITANTTISPDGYQNADTIAFAGSGDGINLFVTTGLSVVSGTTFTLSVFTKSTTQVVFFGGATGGTGTNVYNGAVDYGNGWYRQSVTRTWSDSETVGVQLFLSLNAVGSTILYGFQAELGAYETSYIPTLETSVTRVADAAHKETISSLLGSEGTIHFETTYYPETNTGGGERFVYLQGSSSTTFIRLWQDLVSGQQRFRYLVRTDDVQQVNLQTLVPVSTTEPSVIKWASVFENNRFVTYINGVKLHEQLSGTAPTLQEVFFNNTAQTIMPLSFFAFYQEPFTDAQLAELTTL